MERNKLYYLEQWINNDCTIMSAEISSQHFSQSFSDVLAAPVFILAGGKGSRLRNADEPEFQQTTKVLLEIHTDAGESVSMLNHTLNGLAALNPPHITLLSSEDPLADGEGVEAQAFEWSMMTGFNNLAAVRERTPLGTAGAVRNALAAVPSSFGFDTIIVTPADILFPSHLLPIFLEQHRLSRADATWAVTSQPGDGAQNTGRVFVDRDTRTVQATHEAFVGEEPVPDINDDHMKMTSVGVVALNTAFFAACYDRFFLLSDEDAPVDMYKGFLPKVIPEYKVMSFDVEMPVPDLGEAARLFKFGRTVLSEA